MLSLVSIFYYVVLYLNYEELEPFTILRRLDAPIRGNIFNTIIMSVATPHAAEEPNQHTEETKGGVLSLPLLPRDRQANDTLLSYNYTPLPYHDSIRLLELLPGAKDDKIRCKLLLTRLHDAPKYEAISYVWGTAKVRVECCVEDTPISITPSLSNALRQVRSPTEIRVLWADAICINQGNDQEKGHQVDLMAAIYRNAQQVLVCLDHDKTNWVPDVIRLLHEMEDTVEKQLNRVTTATRTNLKIENTETYADLPWYSFRELLSHDWFTRLWVVQEIGLASKGIVYLGEAQIDWTAIVKLNAWSINYSSFGHRFHFTGPRIFTIWPSFSPKARASFKRSRAPRSFLDLLHLSRLKHRAKDPKDYIYGMLGHPTSIEDNVASFLHVAYEKSTEDIYLDFALSFMRAKRSLNIITYAVKCTKRTEDINVPSWCPRWDRCFGVAHPLLTSSSWHRYQASGDSEFFIRTQERLALGIKGFVIDISITEPYPLDIMKFRMDVEGQVVEQLKGFLEEALALTSRTDILDACHFALSAGRWRERNRAVLEEEFSSFILPVAQKLECLKPDTLRDVETLSNRHHPLRYVNNIGNNIIRRALFVTKNGRVCLGPRHIAKGDLCCIVYGCQVPVVLRPAGNGRYEFVGDACVEGVMRGEAMELLADGKVTEEWFTLI